VIDSIFLRQIAVPSERALRKFTRQGKRAFYRVGDGSSYSPTLFHFVAPDGVQYISAEASLPKFIFGDNVQMLATGADLNRALGAVEEFASEHFGVAFNAHTANVGRIDFCYNFSVGEERIFSYLQAAAEAEPAFLKRRIIGKIETVEFFNKSRKIYCYDKSRETANLLKKGKATQETLERARGILRLEARFNTTGAVKQLALTQFGLPDYTAQTLLDFDIAEKVLTNAIESFCLHEPIVNIDSRIDKLREFYGYGPRLQRLAGFLRLCDAYGYQKVLALGIIKPSAYYKQRNEVRAAGALVFSAYCSTLPPLMMR
jgi:hypothetical protein